MTEKTEKKAASQERDRRGRKTRTPGQATRERARAIAQAEVKPLDVMLKTMAARWNEAQAESDPEKKRELQALACVAAERVAPYLHPKLQATTLKGEAENPLKFVLNLPDADELKKAIRGEK